jgi:hypothetical protein
VTISSAKSGGEIIPNGGTRGVSPKSAVVETPRFFVPAPANDLQFKPIVLNVDAACDEDDTGRAVSIVFLARR